LTHPSSPKSADTLPAVLRIIGGKWRGRKIHFIETEGLRPTPDRVRETLFNWLMPDIAEARVLDLFAGSGALGLEALSRGAAEATFIESSAPAVTQLKKTLVTFKAEQATVIQRRAEDWLQQNNSMHRFDIVFLDPPFASTLLPALLMQLENSLCLAPRCLIYVETDAELEAENSPATWHMHRHKKAGRVLYYLFIRENPQ